MQKLFIVLLWLSGSILLYAQQAIHLVHTIPSELKDNANAVVRLDKTTVNMLSQDKMTVTSRRVVTIFNRAGKNALMSSVGYSGTTKLKEISIAVYNAFGKRLDRFNKKDLADYSGVGGADLYTDHRIKHFEYTPTSYPYTVDMVVEEEKLNTAFIPRWFPIQEYGVSLEKSQYLINTVAGITIRKKEKNFEGYDVKTIRGSNSLKYELHNITAVKGQELSPAFYETEPQVLIAVDKFNLVDVKGEATTWEAYGKWSYDNLIQGRDEISEKTLNEVNQLVAGISDPIEKTKKIYQYVQDNTRYISVQLGIGGWQPILAKEVDKVKYGDCKGLTNYTKALLKTQGIESYYTVVYAGRNKRNLEKDFASMQGNHVILNVPTSNEDIWLECTSQDIPFGFLGDFTDDRDVLVITPEGGVIKHTASYNNEHNLSVMKGVCTLNVDGDIDAEISVENKGMRYDEKSRLAKLSDKDRKMAYKQRWHYLNSLDVKEVDLKNDVDNIVLTEKLTLNVTGFARKVGTGYLLQLNMFNVNGYVPERCRTRNYPLEIPRGYKESTEFRINLPDGLKPDALPEPIKIENKFGRYEMAVTVAGNEILYSRTLAINKGRYPKNEYQDYRDFRRQIAKKDNLKIMLNQ